MVELVDVKEKLDNLVVCYVQGRLMRIVTRNAAVIQSVSVEFTIRSSVMVKPGKYETQETETFDVQNREHGTEIIALSGLLHRLARICRTLQVPLEAVDVDRKAKIDNAIGTVALRMVDPEKYWGSMRDWQQDAARLVRFARCGRVKISTGGGKTEFFKFLVQMLRDYKICITTPLQGDAEEIYKRLASAGIHVGFLSGTREKDIGSRVVVVTTRTLHKVQNRFFHILLADEIHTMASDTLREPIFRTRAARIYGFSANTDDRADSKDLWIEGLFGPTLLERSYLENQAANDVAPIRFRRIETGCDRKISTSFPPARKRAYVVRNQTRNSQIATVARYYLSQGKQVLIITDTTEHVLQLRRLLPESLIAFKTLNKKQKEEFTKLGIWQEGDFSGASSTALVKIQEKFANREYMLAIANSVWHQGKDFRPLEVLIRAEVTKTAKANTQIAGRLSRTYEGKSYGLLVDCIDGFDKTLRASSNARCAYYRKMGWTQEIPDEQT